MKRLCLSAVIELPTDLFEASDVVARVRAPWGDLLEQLKSASVKYDAKADEMEVRAKVQRRPRKPRLVTPPTGEAA